MTTTQLTRRTYRSAASTALLALLATATLAGCGNGVESSDGGSSRSTSSATPTPSPTASPKPRPSQASTPQGGASQPAPSAPATQAPSGPPICAAGDLAVTADVPAGGGAAGSAYVLLNFRNTSSRTCTLDGHPGVSFVGGGDGHQLGTPADFTGGVRLVRIDPGTSMDALLKVADARNYDAAQCAPTDADGFRVYPPDSRASVFVAFDRLQACQSPLGKGHSQLQVSAVGDAG